MSVAISITILLADTITTEGVAELFQKPLFQITCGKIPTLRLGGAVFVRTKTFLVVR